MKFQQRLMVLGARYFNDKVEGTTHDFTKIRVVMAVPEGSKTAVGCAEVEMAWGDHSNFLKIANSKFPSEMELTLQATTKGFEVVDCKPLAIAAPVQQAKAA